MLSVHRACIPFRKGPGSFLPCSQCLTGPFRYQYRARHDDSHAKTNTPPSLRPAATDFLAHQQALFPTAFSEYIRYHDPNHRSLHPEAEEEEVYGAKELELDPGPQPNSDKLNNGHEDRPVRSSPFRKRLDQILSKFLPSYARPNKTDLSFTNPLSWEVNNQELLEPSTTTFRTTDLRKLLVGYLHNVEPCFDRVDEQKLLAALKSTFSDGSLKLLDQTGYDITDVASWAWIFSSDNVNLAFARYVALARQIRKPRHGRLPKFVLLQLLRAESVSPSALKEFIKSILADLQLCLEAKEYFGWNWVTRVCLIVRLLRHARTVAPECFEDVSLIVKHLFFDYYAVHPRPLESPELQRLSHILNRFVSLISLAPLKTPYNAYLWQQNAQLAVVRLMFASKPQLPLTREGYRALIAVQLLHRKTAHERAWAEAKSFSWPPWRQIKSGIEQDLEYPGKESRVVKLLRRMQEAGYTLGDWEKGAAVLAGWDTDQSPTIQTRAILMRQRRPWLLSQGRRDSEGNEGSDAPELWAARIRATRTTREAWASFRSYEKSKGTSQAHYQPYFAMLDKLLVSTVQPGSALAWNYLAGDIKEGFQVSGNPREVIYVDTEVPSVEEFYEQMLRAGVKPGGNLLASLLKISSSAEGGFAYIRDSRWDEVTKDILRHAEKYPSSIIRDSLNKIPIPTLAAFVSLLCKSGPDDTLTFRGVGHLDVVTGQLIRRDDQNVPAMTYASQLLLVAGISDIRVWNAFLEGASVGVEKHLTSKGVGFSNAVWRRLKIVLWPEKMHLSMNPDLDTFRHQAKILHLMFRYVNTRIEPQDIGALAKTTFVRAVYGRRLERFLPSPDQFLLVVPSIEDLKLMVRVLVSIHDTQGLTALLRWMNEHAETLAPLQRHSESNSQDTTKGMAAPEEQPTQSPLREVLCAIRLFLGTDCSIGPKREEDTTRCLSPLPQEPRTMQEAQEHCQVLGWPSDEEVRLFLARNGMWVERVRRAAELMALRKTGRRKE